MYLRENSHQNSPMYGEVKGRIKNDRFSDDNRIPKCEKSII